MPVERQRGCFCCNGDNPNHLNENILRTVVNLHLDIAASLSYSGSHEYSTRTLANLNSRKDDTSHRTSQTHQWNMAGIRWDVTLFARFYRVYELPLVGRIV